jgi:site-specific DNA recombinase
MTAIAIYARYSSDQQRDASIEDQVRLCRERAAAEGWTIYSCYTDHAMSGADMMRPGLQMLLQEAAAGKFAVILAEALDRLSCDQADIAAIHKRLRFGDIRIVTLSEGEISNLHIGLKGTMNALFLQDLADKTRRGLRGRIEAGRSGGGNSYGYDVVRRLDASGEPIRGERVINKIEAGVLRRIFNLYAEGSSSRTIAHRLNAERVPGPLGGTWGASTIHGNAERGTGILNNELYVGRLVWNRLRYIKDPESGRRVSRLNPPSAHIVRDVPELRIIDQDLWDRAKARQSSLLSHRMGGETDGFWDRRRPRTILSGLLKCGSCGGGFVKISADHFGCATARNKGTCDNRLTIRRDRLEAAVLDGLQQELLDPQLCEVFAAEYASHINRLRTESTAALAGHRAEYGRVTREIDRLIQAILDGVPGAQVKDRMSQLDVRKAELDSLLQQNDEHPVRLHPQMSVYYRNQVAALREALTDESRRAEATELIRTLIDRIDLTPAVDGNGRKYLAIDLTGHLAGMLALAADKAKPPADLSARGLQIKLVAGTGFEPVTFRL